MNFAKDLEKETSLNIDIFGACGKGEVSKAEEQKLWPNYKFYLALENSHCRDYISEKFFKVLDKDVIPIVRGAPERYYLSHVLNPSSDNTCFLYLIAVTMHQLPHQLPTYM